MATNSSLPLHKRAGALESWSSPTLSGHPSPLSDGCKYQNNQGRTQGPSLCQKAILFLAWNERRQIQLGDGNMFLVWLSSSRMFFLIPGEVRSQRYLLGPPWNVASTYRCWVIFTRPGVLTSTCCKQSKLLLTTYFSWEVNKHVLVRSVGLRSPIDGGHPKSSSHANPNAQLHCVSGRPTAFYLDNASDSVADFHKYLRWYDFLGQLPITTDSQNHIRDPLTSSLAAIPETHPHDCLICVQWYRRQFWTRENKARFIKNLFNTTFFRLVFLPSRPFDPCSAPLGWVAKFLLEVFLNIAQTLAFVAYQLQSTN